MNPSTTNRNFSRSRGVTLVELLVVMAILSVITALLIPRLRIINKDRNIREAARIVGSKLAQASNRAINDGVAGLIIERNENFQDENEVYYAGTRMYLMRKLPPFAGDDFDSRATVISSSGIAMLIDIPIPLEGPDLIQPGDQIRLNYSSVRYAILNRVTTPPPPSGKIRFRVSLGLSNLGVRPVLQNDVEYPYVIYRQPKKLESSRVDLPDGFFIDLRLSGPLVPTPSSLPGWEQGSVFDDTNDTTTPGDTVQLFFNGRGSISSYSYTNSLGFQSNVPTEAFYFFVTGYDPDSTRPLLENPAAMWVTTDNATGSTNVAYNAPPPAVLTTIYSQAQYSRGIGKTRQSANQ